MIIISLLFVTGIDMQSGLTVGNLSISYCLTRLQTIWCDVEILSLAYPPCCTNVRDQTSQLLHKSR